MAEAIGASGILGIGLETTAGTYVPPVKFIPFNSESLAWTQETYWRRPIRNTPGLVGAIAGDGHVEGEIEFDVTTDILVWLLQASRCTMAKTGTAPGPYTYKFTPSPVAIPAKTLSFSIKRNDEVFGYTGCALSSFTLTIDGGVLKCSASIVGREESTQAAMTAIWPTNPVFGSGSYKLEVPTGTPILDADSFEFAVEDNGQAQNRIKTGLGAAIITFGESNATVTMERDFRNRMDYDKWKQLTAQSISMTAKSGADEVTIMAPVAITDTYEVSIGGQGDLIRASVTYNCAVDSTGKHYELTIKTSENVV